MKIVSVGWSSVHCFIQAFADRLTGPFRAGFLFLFLMGAFCPSLAADGFYCEIMAIEGTAKAQAATGGKRSVKEGDLLKVGDTLEVDRDSSIEAYVDLAYDREWKNVIRVEEGSIISVQSVVPGAVELRRGAVYAKLEALPRDTTFTVETPTAIASVRGTEYRTVVGDEGTEVFNLSRSDVYVFGRGSSGEVLGTGEILRQFEKTALTRPGEAPPPPRRMSDDEKRFHEPFRSGIERRVNENVARGRVGKIQGVQEVSEFFKERNERLFDNAPGKTPLISKGRIPAGQKDAFERQLARSDELIRNMESTQDNYIPPDERDLPQDGSDESGDDGRLSVLGADARDTSKLRSSETVRPERRPNEPIFADKPSVRDGKEPARKGPEPGQPGRPAAPPPDGQPREPAQGSQKPAEKKEGADQGQKNNPPPGGPPGPPRR